MHRMMRRMFAAAVVVALAGAGEASAAYVVLANGTTNFGKAVSYKVSDGTTILTGEGGNQFTYTREQIKFRMADQPPEYLKAVEALRDQKYDTAVAIGESIVQNLRGCFWDTRAKIVIARAKRQQNKVRDAISLLESAFKEQPDLKGDDTFVMEYCAALIAGSEYDKVGAELDRMVATGSRLMAARAQVLRGDMRLNQGLADQALLDYMRTAILFEEEKEPRAEAIYKAAEIFEKRRDKRSEMLYRQLVADHKDSSWGQRAAQKVK